jgi:hypothetical protein
MSSTTERGDRFRDEVADLLRVAGYAVSVEILDGHKRVDIRFEERSFGKLRKYAVEAKDWEAPLDHGDLETIYGGYASLLVSHEIDELLVISRQPIRSAAANAFVRDTPRFSHQTLLEFQESIMGFSEYLRTFIEKHTEDGLENYYVPAIYRRAYVTRDFCGPLVYI